jgi:hypothetical protein
MYLLPTVLMRKLNECVPNIEYVQVTISTSDMKNSMNFKTSAARLTSIKVKRFDQSDVDNFNYIAKKSLFNNTTTYLSLSTAYSKHVNHSESSNKILIKNKTATYKNNVYYPLEFI